MRGHSVCEESQALFEVMTRVGFTVRTTVEYWSLIESKHPKFRGRV
jgi:hypothetical protein